ncbi:MAG: translation initiation factor [Elusimicrobia bacterium]|nr:translation initiation factor [Elusimicrobiota bacterium]MDE2424526.1 translation initiation factor [Elusimicrobiota bacterium]
MLECGVADPIVYSSDPGFRQPEPLRLSFARAGKGSGVTRLERLILHPTLKLRLLTELKKRLGCGGAVKDGVLELQGDHRDAVEAELVKRGYKVKRA